MPANTHNLRSEGRTTGGVVAEPGDRELERLSIDTIRALAMDAVQKANAGHPGTAMALAPLGYTLFKRCCGSTRGNPNGRAAIASC